MAEYKLHIPDMSCAHCEKRIREAVEKAGGVVKSLDLETKKALIEIEADADKVLEIIDQAGYDAGLE
ncbi:MAG: heavy-metal-associated domain-containing protein [Cloacibacillus sp.]